MKLVHTLVMSGWIIHERLRNCTPFVSRKKYRQLQDDYKEVTWQLYQTIINNKQLKEKLGLCKERA